MKSKFVPKPLPHEINMLIAESEIECPQNSGHMDGSSLSVEDDDDEDNRSCAHDTPSRMPLIAKKLSLNHHSSPLKVSFSDEKNVLFRDSTASVTYRPDAGVSGECQAAVAERIPNNNHSSSVDRENLTQVPMMLIFFILICYISIGTVIFSMWENWSVVDGAYFCFVTLSTIGFGDLVPTRTFRGPELQLFACFAYLLLGLVLVAMTFTVVENQLMWKCRRVAVRLRLAREDD